MLIQTMFEHSKSNDSASQEVRDLHSQFWSELFYAPLPHNNLPYDFKLQNKLTEEVGRFEFSLPIELSTQLTLMSQKNNITVRRVAFAAYVIFMQRISSQSDLLLALHLDGVSIPYRTSLQQSSEFETTLVAVDEAISKSLAHMPYDFSTLLTRNSIQSFFVTAESDYLNTSIDWCFIENNSEIKISILYRADLFKAITIERFAAVYKHILKNLSHPFGDQKLIPIEIESLLLTEWNKIPQSIEHLPPAYKMFEEAASLNPKRIAVENSSSKLSYEEVDDLSNRCAQALLDIGIKKEDLVAVILPRTPKVIPVILGVLKSGAGYIPIDTALPEERIAYMLKDSSPKFVIDENNLEDLLAYKNDKNPHLKISSDHTQYLIYTSGSTGNPKGVQVAHKSFSNLMNAMKNKFSFNSNDKILAVTSLSFDVAVSEMFLPLVTGGTLFMASEEEVKDGALLKDVIESKEITMLQATPSTWRMILTAGFTGKSNLRVHCGGEAFPVDLALKLQKGNLEVWNMYGPTEATVLTSCQRISSADDFITIGKPLENVTYYVLDENKCLLPIGSIGELYIGGHAVSKGSHNNPELNAEQFIPNPYLIDSLMYATGDLVRFNSEGEIIWCGRNDGQVKIRGNRIELEEVTSAILKYSQSKNAAVKIFEVSGDQILCAYITGDESITELRENLKKHLPSYMMPNYFIKLAHIPLSPSGKIDTKNLPLPEYSRPELNVEYVSAETSIQKSIMNIWKSFLMISDIGIDDNFFDLGGTSLMAVKVLNEINLISTRPLTIADVFQLTTIKQLAAFVEQKENIKISSNIKPSSDINTDIAIIAMTGRFPGAHDVDEFWQNLIDNKNSISIFSNEEAHKSVTKEQLSDPSFVKAFGELPGYASFDYKYFGVTALAAELMDPQHRKFLELSHEALELAGYSTQNQEQRIGVFAGMGSTAKYSRLVDETPEKILRLGEFNLSLGLEKDYLSTFTAFKLNLQGPALSIHTACSTSLVAVIEAVKNLRSNSCDMAIAGGISIVGNPKSGHHHLPGGITSKNAECRPFDESATGTIFTDGAGIVVLKRLSDAEKDQDNILAVIKGVGLNNDGAHKMSFTAPSMLGQSKAILMAYQDAGISAESIGYIEAHGTATPVGDPIEVQGLTTAFSDSTAKKNFCYVGSVKSNVGHTNTAAGITGLIKAIKIVSTGIIPATVHFKKANPLLNLSNTPFVINNQNTKFPDVHTHARAGVSSFGVGGTNAHIVIEEYKTQITPQNVLEGPVLFKLSARSTEQVEVMKSNLVAHLKSTSRSEWEKIAHTLDVGRIEYNYRTYVTASSVKDLDLQTKVFEKNSKKLFFMFPGQGSHYAGMGRELYEANSIFRSYMDECAQLFKSTVHHDIIDQLFNSDEEKLSDTFYSQPAIFIIEYSLAMTLIHLGVKPDGFIGHSIGEFVAAILNGVFTLEDGIKIISKRAELMQKLPHGRMISIPLNYNDAEKILEGFTLDIAAINAHDSCVIAGDINEIERFKNQLDSQQIDLVELKTSHAFHSRMMKDCYDEFKTFLQTIKFISPNRSMMSTVTAEMESELFATAEYWAKHMLEPVLFHKALKNILSLDNLILLEVGPKNVLTSLALKNNKGSDSQAVIFSTLTSSSTSEAHSFLSAVGKLWSLGVTIGNYKSLIPLHLQKRTIAPVYEFERNYLWAGAHPQPQQTTTTVLNKGIIMATQSSALKNKLKTIFEEASGTNADTYSTATSFLELGMDSLFLSQFAMVLKKELQAQVTFRQLMEEINTIDKLAAHLSATVKIEEEVTQPVFEQHSTPPAPIYNVTDSSGVQDIINRQLDLMAQQIALLKGNESSQIMTSRPAISKNIVTAIKPAAKKIEVNNIKSAFGAQARISTEKTPLDDFQLEQVNQFIEKYTLKTKHSKKFAQDNRRNHADPRAVTGFKPESKEIIYPIVIKKSEMQTMWDVDGNKYIDMINGFGSNFFGNGNPVIKKHVLNQVEEGMEIGPQHPLVSQVSLLINELTGNERTAFCNTGSEAVLGAMRIARTVTGRDKIIVFSGSYHGIHDEVIIRGSQSGKSMPAAPGINSAAVSNMIVLDYGTTESLNIIRELASTVAAVLVEPVQSRRCDFQPVEFLKEVRKITEASKTCLIFDEIITGFRVNLAGAQGFFGIRADICTYGKIIGGGMPIGVVSGKAEYLDALDGGFWQYGDESTPTVGVTYFAGTFVRHPLALASALGALEVLKTTGAKGLASLNLRSQKFVDELNLFLLTESIPMEINNFGSLIKPKWTADVPSGDLFFAIMRFNGIHVYDGFPWFINLAHTDKELAEVLNAFKNAVRTMQRMTLFPASKNSLIEAADDVEVYMDAHIFDQKGAPMPGAKIGRDEQGNPAWFVEDPEKTGQYYLLKK